VRLVDFTMETVVCIIIIIIIIIIIVFLAKLMHKLLIFPFNTYIICLYMFRASPRSSSGGQNCTSAASVVITVSR
jgi:energy-coupling factor transporter transmembrane protein EcfT